MTVPQIQSDSIINLPNLYINGLVVSNTNVVTSLSISLGQCRDSTDNVDICVGVVNANGQISGSPLTLNALKNGANGLDTGVLQNNLMYQVFVIADSRGYNAPAGLISLATNALPLMPLGYDSLRLVGYMPTNSSAQFQFCIMSGNGNTRLLNYANLPILVNGGTSTSFVDYTAAPWVPSLLDNVPVNLYVNFAAAAANNVIQLASPSFQIVGFSAPVAGAVAPMQFEVSALARGPLPTAPQLSYTVSAGAASIYLVNFTYYV